MADEFEESPEETLRLQVQSFLDDWFHRVIQSTLGKQWSHKEVFSAALDIFEVNGIVLSKEERSKAIGGNEGELITLLMSRMPANLRTNFDYWAQNLQMVVTTITRLRQDLEEDKIHGVFEVLEECDKEAVLKCVMKQAVIQASQEVLKIRRCQDSWARSMEGRLARLSMSSQIAEQALSQAVGVEAQLSSFVSSHTQKSKKMLMGLAEGKDKTLVHTTFSGWYGLVVKMKSEEHIREKYRIEAEEAQRKLFEYKQKQVEGVRNVLLRNCQDGDLGLLNLCVDLWAAEVKRAKADGDTAAAMQLAEDRLKAVSDGKKEATKNLMAKMANESDGALILTMFQAWVKHHVDIAKEKELEEAVKKTEAALQDHLKKKKDEAKQVLDRMSGSSDSGLLAMMIKYWVQALGDLRADKKKDEANKNTEEKFKRMAMRQLGTAKGVQARVNEQMNNNLLIRCIWAWVTESKTQRIEKYYTQKIAGKRNQLLSVQNLFKSFATQLEKGLDNLEGDSSGRKEKRASRSQSVAALRQDSVHLPEINNRPVQQAA
mmetsp:Transcript_16247/g.37448  ORF Transcript_16247/g.37448 Transcript_16247/m.37448 type:complete len:544 (+) Transcript_16247:71-1702(+)